MLLETLVASEKAIDTEICKHDEVELDDIINKNLHFPENC